MLLLERLSAAVHTSMNTKLNVIASLLEKEFGTAFTKSRIGGQCLIAQVIYSVAATAQIPARILMRHLDSQGLSSGMAGLTLHELFDRLNDVPIRIGRETLRLHLSISQYDTSAELIVALKAGQPVVCISNSHSGYANVSNDSGIHKGNKDDKLRTSPGNYYHALLAIGYDADEGTVILRESRHIYGLQGYAKAYAKDIDKFKPFKMISINVDSADWT